MNQKILPKLISIAILFVTCGDINDDPVKDSISVITTNVNYGTWYYNLQSNTIDSDTWHISLINISVDQEHQALPSIVLSENVMVSIVENQNFDDITTSPATNTFTANTDNVSLSGADEVLHYDFGIHKIIVSSKIYFLYDTITHRIFKLNFQEWETGVLVFKFIEMDL